MLISLKIQNLILVERAEISFEKGLNILTGETGSGKSAVLKAIGLIAGDRAETQLIGQHGEIAIVEAEISGVSLPEEILFLNGGETLSIRREIHKSGKSRAFIEDQLVPLSILKEVVGKSIEQVNQSSALTLLGRKEQRSMLDLFGDLDAKVEQFSRSFEKEQEERRKLDALLKANEERNRNLRFAQEDLAMIEAVNWQVGEEESLSKEHLRCTHAEELLQKLSALSEILGDPSLKRGAQLLDGCTRFDETLSPLLSALKTALLEIDEVKRGVEFALSRLEIDPSRTTQIEERIRAIEQLKRRFGKTEEIVREKKEELVAQIEKLLHLEEELFSSKNALEMIQKQNQTFAKHLSEERKKIAPIFASRVLKELRLLNLPHAQFEIVLEEAPLSSFGADAIEFLFSANPGLGPVPLDTCASGGELSRLFLAIKTVLSEKDKKGCIVFDEIDGNVGGHTASILGRMLSKLSEEKQVICVTHFVQVAKSALCHFAVSKKEENGIARTLIEKLCQKEKEREYQRMLGNS